MLFLAGLHCAQILRSVVFLKPTEPLHKGVAKIHLPEVFWKSVFIGTIFLKSSLEFHILFRFCRFSSCLCPRFEALSCYPFRIDTRNFVCSIRIHRFFFSENDVFKRPGPEASHGGQLPQETLSGLTAAEKLTFQKWQTVSNEKRVESRILMRTVTEHCRTCKDKYFILWCILYDVCTWMHDTQTSVHMKFMNLI